MACWNWVKATHYVYIIQWRVFALLVKILKIFYMGVVWSWFQTMIYPAMEFLLNLAKQNSYLSLVECLDDVADLLDRFYVDVGILRDSFFWWTGWFRCAMWLDQTGFDLDIRGHRCCICWSNFNFWSDCLCAVGVEPHLFKKVISLLLINGFLLLKNLFYLHDSVSFTFFYRSRVICSINGIVKSQCRRSLRPLLSIFLFIVPYLIHWGYTILWEHVFTFDNNIHMPFSTLSDTTLELCILWWGWLGWFLYSTPLRFNRLFCQAFNATDKTRYAKNAANNSTHCTFRVYFWLRQRLTVNVDCLYGTCAFSFDFCLLCFFLSILFNGFLAFIREVLILFECTTFCDIFLALGCAKCLPLLHNRGSTERIHHEFIYLW